MKVDSRKALCSSTTFFCRISGNSLSACSRYAAGQYGFLAFASASIIPSNFTKQMGGRLYDALVEVLANVTSPSTRDGGVQSLVGQWHWSTKLKNDRNEGWFCRWKAQSRLEFGEKIQTDTVARHSAGTWKFYIDEKAMGCLCPKTRNCLQKGIASGPPPRQQRQLPPLPRDSPHPQTQSRATIPVGFPHLTACSTDLRSRP